jgi:hypothetical protein
MTLSLYLGGGEIKKAPSVHSLGAFINRFAYVIFISHKKQTLIGTDGTTLLAFF